MVTVDFGNDLIYIWKYACFQFGIDPGISYEYLKSSAGRRNKKYFLNIVAKMGE
jgi:hypothetical protein